MGFWKSAWRPEVSITGSGMTPPAHGRTDQRTSSARNQVQRLIRSSDRILAACLKKVWKLKIVRGIFINWIIMLFSCDIFSTIKLKYVCIHYTAKIWISLLINVDVLESLRCQWSNKLGYYLRTNRMAV